DLYDDPDLVRRFPYLPTLRESVLAAEPRPKSPHYDQVSLVVQAVVHDAMTGRPTPEAAVRRLAPELAAVSSRSPRGPLPGSSSYLLSNADISTVSERPVYVPVYSAQLPRGVRTFIDTLGTRLPNMHA